MAKKKEEKEEQENTIVLVKMVRGEETADVHPDEVVNYSHGGWEVDA